MQAQDSEDEGQRVLSTLSDVLLGDLMSQELKQAAEQVKQWAKVNGITPEGKEGSYSQNWLREYLNIVEMSVDKHFPALPPEGSRDSQLQTGEYLKLALSLVWSEVIGLVLVLENSRLLSYLIDSYNRRLFAVLDIFVDRSSSVKEVSILLVWVKQTYFRSYCFNIVDSNNDTNSPTVMMLGNMETHVSSIVRQWFAGLAEDHLKKYFKEKDSVSDDEQKMFLLKMSEILGCSDINVLMLICAALYRDFPKESEEHLPALLKWKRGLSKQQMKKILDVSQKVFQNKGHITSSCLKYWSCCLGYT
ncbi:hypothetical protein SRHO_G00043480 [Serrasalmus rhombeus]